MASTTNTLQPVSVPAEKALFGDPKYTVIDTGTNAALAATFTPSGNNAVARMFSVGYSLSAAPATALTLTVKDGTTVIWQHEISVSAPFFGFFTFDKRPLRASVGAALSANIGAPGVGIVGTVCWEGDTIVNSQG